MIEQLPWDSNFFGIKIGQLLIDPNFSALQIETALEQAKLEKYKLLYIFSPERLPEAQDLLQAYGVKLVDRKVTLVRPVPYPPVPFPERVNRFSEAYPNPELMTLALQAGRFSRFFTDPNFDPEAYKRLYHAWIEAAVSKKMAREVLTFQEKEQILGFLTVGAKNNRADLGLLAVESEARGRQIGSTLLTASLNLAANWGFREIQLITQGDNLPACRFFESHDFREESAILVYHYWIN